MKYFTKEVRIALTAIVALVMLFFGIKFLKGVSLVSVDTAYYINFSNVKGVSVSSVVMANGYKVGTVTDIDYDYTNPGNIKVRIDVNKELRIPRASTASIESDLLGNIRINLDLQGNPTDCLEAGGIIPEKAVKGALDQAADMIPVLQAMLPKIDSILTSVNTLLADPALRSSLHNVEGMTANLNTASADMSRMMVGLNQQMPGLLRKADGVMTNTETLTGNLAAVDIASTMQKVDQTMANVQVLVDKMNSTDGTVGKLLNDPAVYNNLNATMADADSLMIDLKAHPKRYVHFSVFGKKDK